MLPFIKLFERALSVDKLLLNHADYLAHLPGVPGVPAETLAEHADKVMQYALQLTQTHQMDGLVDVLIRELCRPFEHKAVLAAYVKEGFVATIAFHDFGKINPYFQQEKMGNVFFQGHFPDIMKPKSGHSALGAYLFLTYFLNRITPDEQINDREKTWLIAVMLVLANSITQHHSSRLGRPDHSLMYTVLEKDWLSWEVFLNSYQFLPAPVFRLLSEELKTVYRTIQEMEMPFPLFALSRLNFSVLTGADNLATSDYMKQGEVTDFGLIDHSLRERMLDNVRRSETYNQRAFELADQTDWSPPICIDRSPENLNLLRGQMAVEVIRNIRQIKRDEPQQRLFYLEAPTGGGKTNLSMLAAGELLRLCPEITKLYYVFPFTTLVTQTHRAVARTFGLQEHEIGLLHSKAGFRKRKIADENATYGQDWKNDLHLQFSHFPVCLMTHIRFFDFLKSERKNAIYPLHRLANSIVILDEIQSYPPLEWDKILYFIDQYSRYFNIHFVLMSATLPRIDRLNIRSDNSLNFAELLTEPRRFFLNDNFSKRVRFNFDLLVNPDEPNQKRELDLSELADFVETKSITYAETNKGRVFSMIEFIFKKTAANFRLEMEAGQGAYFFDEIFVLSGTILEPRRREIINFLKRQADQALKVLLITTQVVEAGVDIDMDIGFKNISLIDSDEQLAGRINRNVKKAPCDVFLFKVNEPSVLYGGDLRYKLTRDHISLQEHQRILEEKDFKYLYDRVLVAIDQLNQLEGIDNFHTHYLPALQTLDFRTIDRDFRLIDADNLSVFVPLSLPVYIEGQQPEERECLFTSTELEFLEENNIGHRTAEWVDGKQVWLLYRQFLGLESSMEFFEKRKAKKILQGVLAKFTFSIFRSPQIEQRLMPFCQLDEGKQMDSYWCLRDEFEEIYSYETGLMESKLETADCRIF